MQVELGKIVGVWGVKGWVKLHSYTRNREDIADYSKWCLRLESPKSSSKGNSKGSEDQRLLAVSEPQSLNSSDQWVEVQDCRLQGPGVVAKLLGVDSREAAEPLIGHHIFVDQSDLPKLQDGEYYWQQLIGLEVNNTLGATLGRVTSLLETGANDVLVVESDAEGAIPEVLIPYVKEVVLEVDLNHQKMLVEWDPSFLLE